MAKSNVMSKAAQQADKATFRAVRLFLGGCVAEGFLMMIRNYYVNGTATDLVTWDGYMYPMALAGVLVMLAGIGIVLTKGKTSAGKKEAGLWIAGGGLFVAIVCALVRTLYTTLLTPLSILVPLISVLGILWCLYAPECSIAISALGASLVAIWFGRRTLGVPSSATMGMVVLIAFMLALVAVMFVTRQMVTGKKKCAYNLITTTSDPRSIYGACICSLIAVAVTLVSTAAGFYAMWVLIAVIFLLAMYYTVKQL